MSNVIQISDFTGFYEIAKNCIEEDFLQSYIDKYEDYYLTELLGCDLKDLFIADLVNGVPQDATYLSFYNPFCIDDDCKRIKSYGLKNTLLGLVYYHYTHTFAFKHNLTSVSIASNENSTMLSSSNLERVAEIRYNDSVPSYNAIAYKLCKDDIYKYSELLEVKTLFV